MFITYKKIVRVATVVCSICIAMLVSRKLYGSDVRLEKTTSGDTEKRGIKSLTIEFNPKIAQRLQDRNTAIKEACRLYVENEKSWQVEFNTFVDSKYKVIYCQVQKAGSSFWKRKMQFLQNPQLYWKETNLTLIDVEIPRMTKTEYVNEGQWFSSEFFRFTFVRNPYERLFSGFIDKFYRQENFLDIGKHIVRNVRGDKRSHCGHDVTFAEFIKYVIEAEKTGIKRNGHFSSEHEHCTPCKLDYDVIGKMENIDEITHVSSLLGQRMNQSLDIALDSVNDKVKQPSHLMLKTIESSQSAKSCVSLYERMRRTWTDLQMNGYIRRNIAFPFKESDIPNINEHTLRDIISRALSKSGKSLKDGKKDALVEAYSTVPMSDLVELHEILRPDCQIYGYDPKPDYIFNRPFERFQDYRFFPEWEIR